MAQGRLKEECVDTEKFLRPPTLASALAPGTLGSSRPADLSLHRCRFPITPVTSLCPWPARCSTSPVWVRQGPRRGRDGAGVPGSDTKQGLFTKIHRMASQSLFSNLSLPVPQCPHPLGAELGLYTHRDPCVLMLCLHLAATAPCFPS